MNVDATFIVIQGQSIPLLSKNTTVELGVLKTGPVISVITDKVKVLTKQKYPEVFDGEGKLTTKQISLDIDPGAKPIAQPLLYSSISFKKKKSMRRFWNL
mgnify:CR=1 FL=1